MAHLRSQLEIVNAAGGNITIIAGRDERSDSMNQLDYCKFKPIYIAREVSLIADNLVEPQNIIQLKEAMQQPITDTPLRQ